MKTKKQPKTNQRELLFYLLYKEFQKVVDKSTVPFIPLWKFQGEWFLQELQEWTFMSYEVSTTMSKLKKDEPDLFQEEDFHCKNGSVALAYRIRPDIKVNDIKTKEIKDFWLRIKNPKII